MTKDALLIFAKNAEKGKVKTRLASTIGNEAALAVYNQLLSHTVAITGNLPRDKFVFYSSRIECEDVWDDKLYFKQLQKGNDLGERMNNAFAASFKKSYDSVVIIGTDCPELNEAIVMKAFAFLRFNDVIIGPAEDGGYYLLGMKQLHSKLFENIRWSTSTVLADTIEICKSHNLTHTLLPTLHDVDEEKDLSHLNVKV